MKGYKAFHADMTCRGYQYTVGKTHVMDGEIKICERGFHFCRTIADCYDYYSMDEEVIICEVESGPVVHTDNGIKYVTNELTVLRVIDDDNLRKGNTGRDNTGYLNSGIYNTGNRNTGSHNKGDGNTGFHNEGCRNTGSHNIGTHNTGDWNCGSQHSGCFCTDHIQRLKFFDADSDWTMVDWRLSRACRVMECCPSSVRNRQTWWNHLPTKDQLAVLNLPNFDPQKFKLCTGIEVEPHD